VPCLISEYNSVSNKKRLDRLQIKYSKLLQVREALIQYNSIIKCPYLVEHLPGLYIMDLLLNTWLDVKEDALFR